MKWIYEAYAQSMLGRYKANIDNMPAVMAAYKRYLAQHAPRLVATLDEAAAEEYFISDYYQKAQG